MPIVVEIVGIRNLPLNEERNVKANGVFFLFLLFLLSNEYKKIKIKNKKLIYVLLFILTFLIALIKA